MILAGKKLFVAGRVTSGIVKNALHRYPTPQAAKASSSSYTTLCSKPIQNSPTYFYYLGFATIAATASMKDSTKCDLPRRGSIKFDHRRPNDLTGRVISLKNLDLGKLSNETTERLIEALNNGAQLDRESLIELMSMNRRLSTKTARTLIEALDNGASFDKESLIKLVRLQLASGPLSSATKSS